MGVGAYLAHLSLGELREFDREELSLEVLVFLFDRVLVGVDYCPWLAWGLDLRWDDCRVFLCFVGLLSSGVSFFDFF